MSDERFDGKVNVPSETRYGGDGKQQEARGVESDSRKCSCAPIHSNQCVFKDWRSSQYVYRQRSTQPYWKTRPQKLDGTEPPSHDSREPDDEWPPCCQEAHDFGFQMGKIAGSRAMAEKAAQHQPKVYSKLNSVDVTIHYLGCSACDWNDLTGTETWLQHIRSLAGAEPAQRPAGEGYSSGSFDMDDGPVESPQDKRELTADEVRIALQPIMWKQFAWREAADALNAKLRLRPASEPGRERFP